MKQITKPLVLIAVMALIVMSIFCSCNKPTCKCITYDFTDSTSDGVWEEVSLDGNEKCEQLNFYGGTMERFCYDNDSVERK